MYLCTDHPYSQSYFHRLIMAMGEKNGGLSVPQFGAWDSKNPVPTNYSMVFTRARANRKQHKSDVRHASLGNERELLAAACQQEEPVIKNGGLSVPQFGAWDSKNPVPTNYSMVFTRARANRKQHKSDVRHASLGNERELLAAACQQEEPVIKRKKILTYIHCCTRP